MHGGPQATDWLCSQTWDISGYSDRYDVFTATIGKWDVQSNRKTIVTVEVDGEERYNSGEITAGFLQRIEVDIKDGQELTLKVNAGPDGCNADMVVFAYAALAEKAGIKLTNLEIAGLSEFAVLGEELDLSCAVAVATYNNYTFEEIPLTSENVSVTGYDKTKTGKQTVSVTYGGKTVTKDIAVLAQADYAYVADLEWATSTAYPGLNKGESSNSGTDHLGLRIQIAGKPTYKSIYTCPLNVQLDSETGSDAGSRAGVSVELDGKGYTWLRGYAGKTYAASNAAGACAKYYIIGDGSVLAQSDDIYIGDVWNFNVNIAGVKNLELLVALGSDNSINGDFSAFADTVIYKGETDIFAENPPAGEQTTEAPTTESPTEAPTAPADSAPAESHTSGTPSDETGTQPTEEDATGCSSVLTGGVVVWILAMSAAGMLLRKKKF